MSLDEDLRLVTPRAQKSWIPLEFQGLRRVAIAQNHEIGVGVHDLEVAEVEVFQLNDDLLSDGSEVGVGDVDAHQRGGLGLWAVPRRASSPMVLSDVGIDDEILEGFTDFGQGLREGAQRGTGAEPNSGGLLIPAYLHGLECVGVLVSRLENPQRVVTTWLGLRACDHQCWFGAPCRPSPHVRTDC